MKVVSLEVAKQLKEKGYNETAEFYYWKRGTQEWQLDSARDLFTGDKAIIAAPSADEMLDLLPDFVILKGEHKLDYWLYIGREDKYTWILYYEFTNKVVEMILEKEEVSYLTTVGTGKGKSLADAAANCWLVLKKNDLLGVK